MIIPDTNNEVERLLRKLQAETGVDCGIILVLMHLEELANIFDRVCR